MTNHMYLYGLRRSMRFFLKCHQRSCSQERDTIHRTQFNVCPDPKPDTL